MWGQGTQTSEQSREVQTPEANPHINGTMMTDYSIKRIRTIVIPLEEYLDHFLTSHTHVHTCNIPTELKT